ncbi:MAG: DoxX-like family [Thermoleophilaceae bacterium]|jgi:hypothetical protein|nr:DoxX-like family [Thermoleophilaceae bacterium]
MTNIALIVIAVIFALASLIKLASTQMALDNFERWGLPDSARYGIGIIEAGMAVFAVIALMNPVLAVEVAIASLVIMAGALATHIRVRDEAKEYVPFVFVTAAAVYILAVNL